MQEKMTLTEQESSPDLFKDTKEKYLALLEEQYKTANSNAYKNDVEGFVQHVNHEVGQATEKQKIIIFLTIEKAVFAAEREFMKVEDRKIALPPRTQHEMIKQVQEITSAVENDGKAGGVMNLVGPPGIGKTEFVLALARRLHFANGVVQFDVNPGARLANQYVDTDKQHSNGAEKTLELLNEVEQSNGFAVTFETIAVKYIWSQEASPVQLINATSDFFKLIQSDENPSLTLNDVTSINYKSNKEFTQLLLNKVGSTDQLIPKLISFFITEKIRETSSNNILKGVVYEAMRRGLVLVVNELEKEAIAALLPGYGAEGMLRINHGITYSLNNVAVEVKKGFLVLSTANDAEAIPAHTQSRLPNKHEDVKVSDFFYQARVLLTAENGSYFFENDQESDSQLTYFLLWFNQIARFQPAGYRTNLLAKILNKVKVSGDFDEAIEATLPTDLVGLYHTFALDANEFAPLSLRDFSLLAFNEVVSLEKINSPNAQKLQTNFDHHTSSLNLVATNTGNNRNPHAVSKQVELNSESFNENTSSETSPLFQTTALISGSGNQVAFIDLPSGEVMPTQLAFTSEKKMLEGAFFLPNIQKIVKVHLATDTTGFILGKNEANMLIVYPFMIENTSQKKQELSKPTVVLFAQKQLSKSVVENQIHVTQQGNIFSVNGIPSFMYNHTAKFTKLIREVT